MAIAQHLSNFTMGQAGVLRKAMGSKNPEVMAKTKDSFVEGAVDNNIDRDVAEGIFDTIEKFAGYGFNKSHALAYAMMSYRTAYLRKYYPTEFMAAVFSVDAVGNKSSEKLEKDIQSVKEVDLKLFGPQLNNSGLQFKAGQTNGILYGLSGIKGASFNQLVKERTDNGNFKNIEDLMHRLGAKKSVLTLIESSALDSIPMVGKMNNEQSEYVKSLTIIERKVLKRLIHKEEFVLLEPLLSSVVKRKAYTPDSLVDTHLKELRDIYSSVLNKFKNNNKKIMAKALLTERELIGGYVTAHPIDLGENRRLLKENSTNPQIKLNDLELDHIKTKDAKFTISVCIGEFSHNKTSMMGKKYAVLDVSDEIASSAFYMSNDGFDKLNQEVTKQSGKGLQEGTVVNVDVSFYKKGDEMQTSVNGFYLPEYDIKVDVSMNANKPKYKNN